MSIGGQPVISGEVGSGEFDLLLVKREGYVLLGIQEGFGIGGVFD